MTSVPNSPWRRENGVLSLPEPVANLLIEIAQPIDSAQLAIVGQFETEVQAAVKRYASCCNINVVCERVDFDQIIDRSRAPLLSSIPSEFDVALLTPPFVQMRHLPESIREQLYAAVELPDYATTELAYLLLVAPLLRRGGSTVALVSEGALRQMGRSPIRESILRDYEIDLVVLLPRLLLWDAALRTGVIKLNHRDDHPAKPALFSIANDWSDWPALKSILTVYAQIATKTFLDVQMDKVGSSALFSLETEDILPYNTLLPTQLLYAGLIQALFDRYETVELGDIAEISRGVLPRLIDRESKTGQERLISARCITKEVGIQNPRFVSIQSPDVKRQERWTTQEGDILIAGMSHSPRSPEPGLLRLAIVPSQWAGAYFDSTVIRLRVQPNKWNITSNYVFRILRQEYELRPEFAEVVELQLNALSSGPHVPPSILQQLKVPILPESIRQLLGRHVDVVDIAAKISQLQKNIDLLTEGLERLKMRASVEGKDVEEVIACIGERIASFAKRINELDVQSYQDKLRNEIAVWEQLEGKSRQFLLTTEWSLANFEPMLDFAPAALSVWKCLETELHVKVFEPFRQWIRGSDVSLNKPKSWKFVKFIQGKWDGLTVGQMLREFGSLSENELDPLLQAFRCFLEEYCATPGFFLSKEQGIGAIISKEDVEQYRNSAAHTGVFAKDKAVESRDLVVGNLERLIKAIGPRQAKHR